MNLDDQTYTVVHFSMEIEMLKTKVVKSLLSASILVALAAPVALYAQTSGAGMNTPAASTLNKADQRVLMDMARANMAEIETGKIALSKTQNAEVKAYAQRMIDDHTKALNDVTQLAQNKGVTLPTEPNARDKAMAAKLSKMEGDAFDRAYMKQAGLQNHAKVHSMLKRDAGRAKDPDVKALASKMMPTVEQHLNSAKEMPMLKGSAGETTGRSSSGATKAGPGEKGMDAKPAEGQR